MGARFDNRNGPLFMLMDDFEKYLQPTAAIDCNSIIIQEKANLLIDGIESATERAHILFYFTRDSIRYNPYAALHPLQASETLKKGDGFCVQKAVLLAALFRAIGIPARLGFVDIRNHRLDPDWQKIFRTDVVVFHGFTELFIEGQWVKATPAFDLRMCRENGFLPVDFDGTNHAMLHSHDLQNQPHIDYVGERGHFDDVPTEIIIETVTDAYGSKFLECWKSGNWDYFLSD